MAATKREYYVGPGSRVLFMYDPATGDGWGFDPARKWFRSERPITFRLQGEGDLDSITPAKATSLFPDAMKGDPEGGDDRMVPGEMTADEIARVSAAAMGTRNQFDDVVKALELDGMEDQARQVWDSTKAQMASLGPQDSMSVPGEWQ